MHARLGSYEAWSDTMGGILAVAGIPGFLSNLPEFYANVNDDETAMWHALVAAWWTRYGDVAVGVKDVWTLTQGEHGIDFDLSDKNERAQRTRLGRMLGRMKDRIFDGHRVSNAGTLHGAQQWRLLDVGAAEVNV
jgi:putative DNA primase/helicase